MIRIPEKVTREEYEVWYAGSEELRREVAADPRRLAYHLMPPTGWMNDPNGLCQLDGVYHIYYQYSPFDATGERKLWGHYSTRDFVHYVDGGPVLFPDLDRDAQGVFSGSALTEQGQMHLFYTGNVLYTDRDDYDYINSGRGSNTIAVTSRDGQHMTEKELLLTSEDYPKDMSRHVRDPKVFKRNGRYYMVLGARSVEDRGLVLLYISDDRKHWTYKSRITLEESFGYMWECPDLFELDGQWFLTCCPQGVPTQGIEYENVYQNVWMQLDCDLDSDRCQIRKVRTIDRGCDFYAQQTFLDEKGRRILIGWMGMADTEYGNPTTDSGWQHALTLPRELTAREGRLLQNPIEELKQLRDGAGTEYALQMDKVCSVGEVPLLYEALADFGQCDRLTMRLRGDVTLTYEEHILTLDTGSSGAGRPPRHVYLEKLSYLQIFVDTTSVEIFVNHGEEVFSSRIYSFLPALSAEGAIAGTLTVYPLKGFAVEVR